MKLKLKHFIAQALFTTVISSGIVSADTTQSTLTDQNTANKASITNMANPANLTKIIFTPPPGWHFAESKDLPASVKVMVIGKGEREFPPSINLGTETYQGTVKQYLKRIKEINASQGHEWKDLGKIQTQAGEASLSQADSKNKWGNVRMMHVIIKHENMIYIMTAASLKDEFPKFYKDFFAAFRSLRFEDPKSGQ